MCDANERIVDSYRMLDFRFVDSPTADDGQRIVAFAPDGRVGILEVTELLGYTNACLLVSINPDRRAKLWTAVCVAALCTALETDFADWLRSQIQRHMSTKAWSASKRFSTVKVTAHYYPTDTVLVSVSRPRAALAAY